MKLNKKLLVLTSMLSIIALGGCSLDKDSSSDEDKKLAYASSSALTLVNTSFTTSRGKEARRAYNPANAIEIGTGEYQDKISELVASFDAIFDANKKVEVEVSEVTGGKFAYTSNIAIGANKEFTYTLNYNQEVSEEKTVQNGELVVSYVPLELDLTLNYSSSISYDNVAGAAQINFKLYFDLTNKESTSTYIEVNEVIDSKEMTSNKFEYSIVVNDKSVFNYSIEIPVANGDSFILKMGSLTFEVTKSEKNGKTTITFASKLGDQTLFSFSFQKNEDEDGKITYTIVIDNK